MMKNILLILLTILLITFGIFYFEGIDNQKKHENYIEKVNKEVQIITDKDVLSNNVMPSDEIKDNIDKGSESLITSTDKEDKFKSIENKKKETKIEKNITSNIIYKSEIIAKKESVKPSFYFANRKNIEENLSLEELYSQLEEDLDISDKNISNKDYIFIQELKESMNKNEYRNMISKYTLYKEQCISFEKLYELNQKDVNLSQNLHKCYNQMLDDISNIFAIFNKIQISMKNSFAEIEEKTFISMIRDDINNIINYIKATKIEINKKLKKHAKQNIEKNITFGTNYYNNYFDDIIESFKKFYQYPYKENLIEVENGLDIILSTLLVFKSSFNGCYNDYDDDISYFRKIRNNNIRKYPSMTERIEDSYYQDIKEAKDELKDCLSSKGDFLANLKALRSELNNMKETIDISRNSIPRLKKNLNKVNNKILRIIAEINALEGNSFNEI